ncbi:MAG: ATP-binding protein [Acidobacteria bacterium]|nr:ATP-binding protein [Acidobacteriota bacterium]
METSQSRQETPVLGVLHFFCGKAGAGKSTLAAKLAKDLGAVLLSEDVMLSRLFGDQMKVFDDYLRFSRRLKTVVGPLTAELLAAGRSVVLDFQANTRASRAWFLSVCGQVGATHVLHYLDTADSTCLQRIAERNVERPEGSHFLSEEDFRLVTSFFEPPTEEGLNVRVYREFT